MAKISLLPAATGTFTGAEAIPIVRAGVTMQLSSQSLANKLIPLIQPDIDTAAQDAAALATAEAGQAQSLAEAAANRTAMLAGIAATFVTFAEAQAGRAALADNAIVQVLVDENQAGHRTLYRYTNGALVFIFDTDAGAGQTIRPKAFGAMGNFNPHTLTGADDTAAIQAALTALYAAGGGTLALGRCAYRLTRALTLANTSTAAAIGTQPAIRIVGHGCSANGGKVDRWIAASTLFWTSEAGEGVAKIDTRGLGTLTLLDFDLASGGLQKPFIHTTFTTLFAQRVGFVTSSSGLECTDDAIVCGGDVDFEVDAAFDRRSADCGFQGYGTVIDTCFFNGIRRALVTRRHANAICFTKNSIWGACGNASATGAAIEADGAATGALTYAVGNLIFGNLFEMGAYRYAVHLKRSYAWHIGANGCYDADDEITDAAVYVDPSCVSIRVDGSLRPAARKNGEDRPYLVDPGKVCISIPIYADEPTRFGRIDAGDDQFPNRFGTTLVDAPGAAPFVFQSRQDEVAVAPTFMVVRHGYDPLSPVGDKIVFIPRAGGQQDVGGPKAGDLYNHWVSGVSRWDNGRSWGWNRDDPDLARRIGGNLVEDTGIGGSTKTVFAVSHLFRSHTGALIAEISDHVGGAGKAGFAFGPDGDTKLYRVAPGVLETNAALSLGSFRVQDLPLPLSVAIGTFAFAQDGRLPGQAAGAGSGCPVYVGSGSDGQIRWRTFSDGSPVAA
ncbi:hypothetical protein [Sphingomonas melonis]|uniref:hypothetical protein n=1 Tax=Sphingomonas melonis TaxID=152682 RepID=UPI0035C7D03E